MYKISALLVLVFALQMNAQKKVSNDEMSVYQKEVKKTILEFFDGFHKGDTAAINKVITSTMTLQTVAKNKEGKTKVFQTPMDKFLSAIHNRPDDQKWDERLLSFTITADSQIANAWTPYEFYVNDTFSHCGVNVFQLYNDGKSWRILNIADTRKRKGCK